MVFLGGVLRKATRLYCFGRALMGVWAKESAIQLRRNSDEYTTRSDVTVIAMVGTQGPQY